MGRPPGARSQDYEAKRHALAHAILTALIDEPDLSLRRMAEAAGVSRPTVLHYFGSRDGAIHAALEVAGVEGEIHRELLERMPLTTPREVLRRALTQLAVAWREFGVGNLHNAGLQVALRDAETAAEYRKYCFEPLFDSVGVLLRRLVKAGHLPPLDLDTAPLLLVGPLLMSLLHQHGLGGDEARPIDLQVVVDASVDAFLRAHPAPSA